MKKFITAIIISMLLVSCATTENARIETLDMETDYPGLLIVPEENLSTTMTEEVEPFLKQYLEYGTITSTDHNLFYEYYNIPNEKGSVVVLHGFSEFVEKYNEIVWYFMSQGYDVFLIEHYGHGFSDRSSDNMSKVDVENFQTYVDDVEAFMVQKVLPSSDPEKPLFLFAHSMGGGVATRYLESYPGRFDAAVLTAPMLGVNMGGIPQGAAVFISSSAKLFGQGEGYVFGHYDFDGKEDFANSPATSYERYRYGFAKREQLEWWQTYGATWNWLSAAIKATKLMAKEAENIKIPMLIFQAENDTLVRNDKQVQFAAKVPTATLVKVPNSKHEIFNSSNDVVRPYWATIFLFLDEVTSSLLKEETTGGNIEA